MNIDGAAGQLRPIAHILAYAFIIAALIKFSGFVPQIRTEFWQLAVIGLALKSW